MDVYEAVTSRRAVRGFTDRHVPKEVLERVLSAAGWSPSGSNLQPWNIYVVTGAPLAELKTRAVEHVAHGDPWDERQYEMYPPALKSPYGDRRSAFGKERYSALGIAREDWEARQRAAIANWNCFGAPAALFCYIDRGMCRPQWVRGSHGELHAYWPCTARRDGHVRRRLVARSRMPGPFRRKRGDGYAR